MPYRSRPTSLLLVIICLAAFFLPSCLQAANMDAEELAFVTLINNYRQQNGLRPLKISDKLDAAAGWMSADMAQKNYFNHIDSLGRDPFQRMTAFGYAYATYKGENIAAGNSTASQTFSQWQSSSGHNANMLNPNYTVMGIARAYNANSTYHWYWTNDFGGYDDSGSVTPAPTDTIAPTINITSPANGVTISGTFALQAAATDNVGVTQVAFSINGVTSTLTNAPYFTTVDTTGMKDGVYTITATAYDAAGNHSSQNILVTIKNSVSTTIPGTPVTVRLSPQATGVQVSWAPGNGGAAARYELQVYRSTFFPMLVNTVIVPASTTTVHVSVSATGSYSFRIRAVNAAGASAYSAYSSARIIAGP